MNLPLVFTILRWIGRPSALPAKVRTTVAAKQNGKKTPSLRLRPIDRLASSNVLYGCTENLRKPRVMIVTIISDDLKATCPPIPTGKGPGFCCRYLREQRALRVACGVYVESNLQFEFPRNAFSSLATPMSYLPCNSCCHWTFRKILRLELSEILFEELQIEQKQTVVANNKQDTKCSTTDFNLLQDLLLALLFHPISRSSHQVESSSLFSANVDRGISCLAKLAWLNAAPTTLKCQARTLPSTNAQIVCDCLWFDQFNDLILDFVWIKTCYDLATIRLLAAPLEGTRHPKT